MKRVKELFQDIKWFAVALFAVTTIRDSGEGTGLEEITEFTNSENDATEGGVA